MAVWIMAGGLLLSSCASTRKISQVGLRAPSSVVDANTKDAIDGTRAELTVIVASSSKCQSLALDLRFLAIQKVSMRDCPAQFPGLVQALSGASVFRSEEKSFLESLVNANCRNITLGSSGFEEQLRSLVDTFEQSGHIAHYRSPASQANDEPALFSNLKGLRSALQDLILDNVKLESWIQANGDFVIPSPAISVFQKVLSTKACVLSDELYDPVSQYTEVLERLQKLLPPGEQKDRVGSLVEALQGLVYEKVPGFFSLRGET